MSLYNKKKTLAVALAAVMFAPAAFAYNVTTGEDRDPEEIAVQVGSTVVMSEDVEINIELGDILVGRTTGFQVQVTLRDGATFGPNVPVMTAGDALTGWTISLAAGGGSTENRAQFTFEPGSTGATVSDGVLATLSSATVGGLQLGNVPTADGATTRAEFLVRDPVSGATLHSYTATLIVRDDGLAINCTAEEQPYRIDVGEGEYDPRTAFVDFPYEIGGGEFLTASLGEIEIAASAGLELDPTDELTSTITGNFAGFESIFLSADECETGVEYTINTDETSATLEATVAELGEDEAVTTLARDLCVTVDGETQIAAQTFAVQNSLTVTPDDEEITIAGGVCNVAPLQYNGSVVDVYHVNPAGNTTAQSFVRVINPSDLSGRVTVIGWDDAGNEAGPISFDLPAGQSKQFNSIDLEEGAVAKGITGSFGDGAGKWRLEITGEFDGMIVQGLNRNQTDGTVTNLTDADAQMEQQFLHRSTPEGFWGL